MYLICLIFFFCIVLRRDLINEQLVGPSDSHGGNQYYDGPFDFTFFRRDPRNFDKKTFTRAYTGPTMSHTGKLHHKWHHIILHKNFIVDILLLISMLPHSFIFNNKTPLKRFQSLILRIHHVRRYINPLKISSSL